MSRHYLINAILLGIGILIGYTLLSSRSQEEGIIGRGDTSSVRVLKSGPVQSDDFEQLASLRQQLNQERQAREQLRARLETLQIRVEGLEHARSADTEATKSVIPSLPADTVPVVKSSVQSLIEAGISEEQAIWLQERLDETELRQLYLRDRATREGWLNSSRYHKERQQYLNTVTKLRDEVDNDVYDRLLYALGRANRVVIKDVIQNSVAGQYGLQGGDSIIEYDGQRIFNSNELSSLVTQGGSGVMTLVRVKRGGEILDIYLPRGPLGIRMSATRIQP
jgi:hypothetical protein